MLRPILLLLLASITAGGQRTPPAPLAARWKVIVADSLDYLSVDTAGINNPSRVKAVWVQRIAGPDAPKDSVKGRPVLRELVAYLLDCDRATTTVMEFIKYGLGGDELEATTFGSESKERAIFPGSYAERIRRVACVKRP